MLFPQSFSLIATAFLATKIGHFIFQPVLVGIVDCWRRSHTEYLGTALTPREWIFLVGLIAASIVAGLGLGLMDIAIGSDWIPTLVATDDLARVNSRMKQTDLTTEVVSPPLAGILLGLSAAGTSLWGLSLEVLWNILSFVPEIFLLRQVFKRSHALQEVPCKLGERKTHLLRIIGQRWISFWKYPASAVMIALGLFRRAGALFGHFATLIDPRVVRRLGLLKGSLAFICLQSSEMLLALPLFYSRYQEGFNFLMFILASRIGLYGFSMGEIDFVREPLL